MIFPESCFIDSNIFLSITLKKASKKLQDFVNKVKFGEIKGFINVVVVSEIFHKTAINEITKTRKVSYQQALELVKEEPKIIKKLKTFKVIKEILDYEGIEILGIDKETVSETIKIAKENVLLFQDALIACCFKENKIENILTNDRDFERVEFLNIIKIN